MERRGIEGYKCRHPSKDKDDDARAKSHIQHMSQRSMISIWNGLWKFTWFETIVSSNFYRCLSLLTLLAVTSPQPATHPEPGSTGGCFSAWTTFMSALRFHKCIQCTDVIGWSICHMIFLRKGITVQTMFKIVLWLTNMSPSKAWVSGAIA